MTYGPWLGPAHSGANYGCLYTGKAVASALAGPVAVAMDRKVIPALHISLVILCINYTGVRDNDFTVHG